MIEQSTEFFEKMYRLFNARDIDGVFELLHPNVMWANGMEGGHVHGLEEVRKYWTRQWEVISTKVTPIKVDSTSSGFVVEVRQEVYSVAGELLDDSVVSHSFSVKGDKIDRFDILENYTRSKTGNLPWPKPFAALSQ